MSIYCSVTCSCWSGCAVSYRQSPLLLVWPGSALLQKQVSGICKNKLSDLRYPIVPCIQWSLANPKSQGVHVSGSVKCIRFANEHQNIHENGPLKVFELMRFWTRISEVLL